MGLPLLAGRGLESADVGTKNIVITASLSKSLHPDGSPLGRRLLASNEQDATIEYTVVGVVGDFPQGSFRSGTRAGAIAISSTEQMTRGTVISVVMSTAETDDIVASSLVKTVKQVFPGATAIRVASGRQLVAEAVGRERLALAFFGGFGVVALFLACTGVFGLVSLIAESRRREFGVRLALGATPAGLLRFTLLTSLRPVLTGAVGGILLAAIAATLLAALIHGLSPWDPVTYIGAAIAALGVTFAVGLAAARRILHCSPLDSMRG